jgi:hypothetical protein
LQVGSFFNVMNCMSVSDLKLAMVAEDPADTPKLNRVRPIANTPGRKARSVTRHPRR